jgi:hypothetical protein
MSDSPSLPTPEQELRDRVAHTIVFADAAARAAREALALLDTRQEEDNRACHSAG